MGLDTEVMSESLGYNELPNLAVHCTRWKGLGFDEIHSMGRYLESIYTSNFPQAGHNPYKSIRHLFENLNKIPY